MDAMSMDEMKEMMMHVKDHIKYPATKQQIMEACNNMEHVTDKEKEMFRKMVPDGTYSSADDVMKAAGVT